MHACKSKLSTLTDGFMSIIKPFPWLAIALNQTLERRVWHRVSPISMWVITHHNVRAHCLWELHIFWSQSYDFRIFYNVVCTYVEDWIIFFIKESICLSKRIRLLVALVKIFVICDHSLTTALSWHSQERPDQGSVSSNVVSKPLCTKFLRCYDGRFGYVIFHESVSLFVLEPAKF
jgi:hypothetical protein